MTTTISAPAAPAPETWPATNTRPDPQPVTEADLHKTRWYPRPHAGGPRPPSLVNVEMDFGPAHSAWLRAASDSTDLDYLVLIRCLVELASQGRVTLDELRDPSVVATAGTPVDTE